MADETGGTRRGRRARPTTIDVKPDAPGTIPADSEEARREAAAPSEAVEPAVQAAAPGAAETTVEAAAEAEARPPEEPGPAAPEPATAEAHPATGAERSDALPPTEAAPGPASAEPAMQRHQAEVEPAPPPHVPEPIVKPAPRREQEREAEPRRTGLMPALVGGLLAAGLVLVLGFGAMLLGLFGPSVDREAELRALNERVASLETERRRLLGVQQSIAAVEPRLGAVERMAAELQRQAAQPGAAGPGNGALRGEVTALREQVTALEGRIGGADGGRLASDVARIGAALAALDQRVAALDVAPLRAEIARLGEEVRRLQNAPPSALERNAALVIAAEALERAVARGEGFAAELAAVKSLGIEGIDFAALDARAANGVPSRGALIQRFRQSARAMIAAAQPAPEGTVGRLMQSVGGLVSVRPIGEPAGEGAAATVARVETKLGRGDLAGALADFRSLPAPAQAAAGSFGADLAARVAAESLVDRIKSNILRGAARG